MERPIVLVTNINVAYDIYDNVHNLDMYEENEDLDLENTKDYIKHIESLCEMISKDLKPYFTTDLMYDINDYCNDKRSVVVDIETNSNLIFKVNFGVSIKRSTTIYFEGSDVEISSSDLVEDVEKNFKMLEYKCNNIIKFGYKLEHYKDFCENIIKSFNFKIITDYRDLIPYYFGYYKEDHMRDLHDLNLDLSSDLNNIGEINIIINNLHTIYNEINNIGNDIDERCFEIHTNLLDANIDNLDYVKHLFHDQLFIKHIENNMLMMCHYLNKFSKNNSSKVDYAVVIESHQKIIRTFDNRFHTYNSSIDNIKLLTNLCDTEIDAIIEAVNNIKIDDFNIKIQIVYEYYKVLKQYEDMKYFVNTKHMNVYENVSKLKEELSAKSTWIQKAMKELTGRCDAPKLTVDNCLKYATMIETLVFPVILDETTVVNIQKSINEHLISINMILSKLENYKYKYDYVPYLSTLNINGIEDQRINILLVISNILCNHKFEHHDYDSITKQYIDHYKEVYVKKGREDRNFWFRLLFILFILCVVVFYIKTIDLPMDYYEEY